LTTIVPVQKRTLSQNSIVIVVRLSGSKGANVDVSSKVSTFGFVSSVGHDILCSTVVSLLRLVWDDIRFIEIEPRDLNIRVICRVNSCTMSAMDPQSTTPSISKWTVHGT